MGARSRGRRRNACPVRRLWDPVRPVPLHRGHPASQVDPARQGDTRGPGRRGQNRGRHGPVLELTAGDIASLPAGARTTWYLTTPFKEFWVITSGGSAD